MPPHNPSRRYFGTTTHTPPHTDSRIQAGTLIRMLSHTLTHRLSDTGLPRMRPDTDSHTLPDTPTHRWSGNSYRTHPRILSRTHSDTAGHMFPGISTRTHSDTAHHTLPDIPTVHIASDMLIHIPSGRRATHIRSDTRPIRIVSRMPRARIPFGRFPVRTRSDMNRSHRHPGTGRRTLPGTPTHRWSGRFPVRTRSGRDEFHMPSDTAHHTQPGTPTHMWSHMLIHMAPGMDGSGIQIGTLRVRTRSGMLIHR